jgi:hypothetical protein
MASCGASIYPPVQCTSNLYTISQSHLLSSPITSSSHTKWVARHFPALRQSRCSVRRDKLVLRRWRIECSAADAASSSAGASDESPYQVNSLTSQLFPTQSIPSKCSRIPLHDGFHSKSMDFIDNTCSPNCNLMAILMVGNNQHTNTFLTIANRY